GSELKGSLLFIHKSLGLTVLILVFARLAYRLAVGKPPYREPLHRFNRVGSSAAHLFLYALMILMPISGYVFTGAAGRPLPFFGLFEWPSFVPKDTVLSKLAGVFLDHLLCPCPPRIGSGVAFLGQSIAKMAEGLTLGIKRKRPAPGTLRSASALLRGTKPKTSRGKFLQADKKDK